MLKILLEKDKSEISTEIKDLLCFNLNFAKIEKREDVHYVILLIEPITANKTRKYKRELERIIKTVANTVAEYIVLNIPPRLIDELCNEKSKDCIFDIKTAKERATKTVLSEIITSVRRKRRCGWYTVLYRRIILNMLENGYFAVNSFIRFRIADFKKNVILRATKILEKLSDEMRYMDFIAMLQSFVDKRRPKLYEMKINVDNTGYTLTDGNDEPLDFSIYEAAKNDNIDKEDLLMGILLTAAPVRILVSADDAFFNTDLFSTMSNVFGDRIIVDYARREY